MCYIGSDQKGKGKEGKWYSRPVKISKFELQLKYAAICKLVLDQSSVAGKIFKLVGAARLKWV